MAMMVHASGPATPNRLAVCWHFNGFVAKQYRFIGKAAHAGGAPFLGINALNAATLAIQAMHVQRETFRDEDHIRVHPIITHGGTSINVVPADVRVETFVRGQTLDAIAAAAAKIDRAAKAGAFAVGATLEIDTLPGYLPLHMDRALAGLFGENAVSLVGRDRFGEVPFIAACTDAGDLSHILPVLHPNHGGYRGGNHTAEWAVADPVDAYITPAKAMAGTLVDLLSAGAQRATAIIRDFKPELTPDAYLAKMRAFTANARFEYG
jgi:metal-dependent amidase/aminoacylase/carboxypeptidase family protein